MSIIANNITIPNNNDFVLANGVKCTKVVANGVTVWEKQVVENYVKSYYVNENHTGESWNYSIPSSITSKYKYWKITMYRSFAVDANGWYISGCGISFAESGGGTYNKSGTLTSGDINILMSSGPTGYITITLYN